MTTSKRSWLVFCVAVFAYIIGLMHRASLGVAGVEAAEHFGTTPSIVSTFVVLQLIVYAVSQVPVGAILDRVGPRTMLTAGSVLMALGQFMMGAVDLLALGFVARVLVGFGDACMYISILALIPRWFAPRRAPIMVQMAGMFAVFGQLSAVYALLPMIQELGWRNGLWIAAACGIAGAAVAWSLVRNAPPGVEFEKPTDRLSELPKGLWSVLRHPGAQLGFFIHFTSGFSMNAFVFMWGIPYLRGAQGLSQGAAAAIFTLISIAGLGVGPVLGVLTARHPLRRSNLALAIIWFGLACWLVILLNPAPSPLWLISLLAVALAAGGPSTAIGFDFPRTLLPRTRLGVANGVVISGAWLGATVTILLIGILLSIQSGGAKTYTFEQWQWAMAAQIPMYLVGLAGIYITRTRLRRRMEAGGVVVPPWREALARTWRKQRRRRAH